MSNLDLSLVRKQEKHLQRQVEVKKWNFLFVTAISVGVSRIIRR